MSNDIDINVGQVIFSTMKKACYHEGCRYDFGGLLTQFFRRHRVEKKELHYKKVVDAHPIDLTISRSTAGAHGPILID